MLKNIRIPVGYSYERDNDLILRGPEGFSGIMIKGLVLWYYACKRIVLNWIKVQIRVTFPNPVCSSYAHDAAVQRYCYL